MEREQFLKQLAEVLGVARGQLRPEVELSSLAAWDSMGQLSAISLLDETGARPPRGAIQRCRTVADLLMLANIA